MTKLRNALGRLLVRWGLRLQHDSEADAPLEHGVDLERLADALEELDQGAGYWSRRRVLWARDELFEIFADLMESHMGWPDEGELPY